MFVPLAADNLATITSSNALLLPIGALSSRCGEGHDFDFGEQHVEAAVVGLGRHRRQFLATACDANDERRTAFDRCKLAIVVALALP